MNSKELALKPLGIALMAYWNGANSCQILQEYKSGDKKYIPVSVFFRAKEDFYSTEHVLNHCHGRILVVGAGTGVHALELEKLGYQTTSLEINDQAVQIMKERGVKDVRHCDFFEFHCDPYDTILMLGHNIGICEKIKQLNTLFTKCKTLLTPTGQLLANSINESKNHNSSEKLNYIGEQEFHLSFAGYTGPWMKWLHIDFETLSRKARENSWTTEKIIETNSGEYLSRLQPL